MVDLMSAAVELNEHRERPNLMRTHPSEREKLNDKLTHEARRPPSSLF